MAACTSTITANNHHASRLHTKYVKLDFKNDPRDHQDARREGLFKCLVLHHLLAHLRSGAAALSPNLRASSSPATTGEEVWP
jgi:hypothetical protein